MKKIFNIAVISCMLLFSGCSDSNDGPDKKLPDGGYGLEYPVDFSMILNGKQDDMRHLSVIYVVGDKIGANKIYNSVGYRESNDFQGSLVVKRTDGKGISESNIVVNLYKNIQEPDLRNDGDMIKKYDMPKTGKATDNEYFSCRRVDDDECVVFVKNLPDDSPYNHIKVDVVVNKIHPLSCHLLEDDGTQVNIKMTDEIRRQVYNSVKVYLMKSKF